MTSDTPPDPEDYGQDYQPTAQGQNGNNRSEGRLNLQDMFLSRDGRGAPVSAIKELLSLQAKFESYLTRTRMSEKEIAQLTRIVARRNRATKGHTDMGEVVAVKYMARVSLNGLGRAEVIEVSNAELRHRKDLNGVTSDT